MSVLYTNNATTTLSASITNSTTSLSVASGKGSLFPAITGSDFFFVTISNSAGTNEIVKVTARSVDTFTIVRAQDGTSAAAWSAGDKVELRITKAMLDQFKTDAIAAYTASDVLAKLLTVDGAGSGLDADTLDGNHASAFYLATNPSGYTTNTGTVTSVGGTGSYGGLTLSGTVTTSGNLTLGGTPTGTWPISVTGNAATATTLQTARTIQGVSFNGSANITVATASTGIGVSGTAISIASTYSPNTAYELPAAQDLNTYQTAGFYYQTANADTSTANNYPEASAGSLVVQRSAGVTQQYYTYQGGGNSMYFRSYYGGTWGAWYKVLSSYNYNSYAPSLTGTGASGTWGISISGNAATATKLQTARTINGVSFDGSANITITAAANGGNADTLDGNHASAFQSTLVSGTNIKTVDGNSLLGSGDISISGATGGGSDAIFIENGQTVTTNYTITSGNNAMSTGPIAINSGVTVTIPSGSVWAII